MITQRPPLQARGGLTQPPIVRSQPALLLSDADVARIACAVAAEVRLDLNVLRQCLQPWYVKLWLWVQGWWT